MDGRTASKQYTPNTFYAEGIISSETGSISDMKPCIKDKIFLIKVWIWCVNLLGQ